MQPHFLDFLSSLGQWSIISGICTPPHCDGDSGVIKAKLKSEQTWTVTREKCYRDTEAKAMPCRSLDQTTATRVRTLLKLFWGPWSVLAEPRKGSARGSAVPMKAGLAVAKTWRLADFAVIRGKAVRHTVQPAHWSASFGICKVPRRMSVGSNYLIDQ